MGTVYKPKYRDKNGDLKESKTYWLSFIDRHGKRVRRSAGTKVKAVAIKRLDKLAGKAADGRDTSVDLSKIRFEALLEALEVDYQHKGQERLRTGHLKERFSEWLVIDITTTEIKKFIAHRQHQGAAPGTINRELAALKRMFRLGAAETPPKVDRVPHVPVLREDNTKEGFLEHDQFQALHDHLPAHLRPVLVFGFRTGWRINEIRTLTWDRVDLENRTVALSASLSKNRKARHLYLDDELLRIFRHQQLQRGGSDYVFHLDGHQILDFRGSWNRACREAGLGYGYKSTPGYAAKWLKEGLKPGPTFHDLRRSAVRNLIRAGVGRDEAKRITGHLTDSVFSRYNIIDDSDIKAAVLKQQEYLSKEEG